MVLAHILSSHHGAERAEFGISWSVGPRVSFSREAAASVFAGAERTTVHHAAIKMACKPQPQICKVSYALLLPVARFTGSSRGSDEICRLDVLERMKGRADLSILQQRRRLLPGEIDTRFISRGFPIILGSWASTQPYLERGARKGTRHRESTVSRGWRITKSRRIWCEFEVVVSGDAISGLTVDRRVRNLKYTATLMCVVAQ